MGVAYDKLKTRHKRFVDLLCDGKKGSEAMRAINPKCKNPRAAAYHMSHIPEVADAITERNAEIFASTEVTAQRVIVGLDNVAHGDVRKLFGPDGKQRPMNELSAEEAAMIAAVETEIIYNKNHEEVGLITRVRFKDGIRAGEALAKIGGLNKDKIEHSGEIKNTGGVMVVPAAMISEKAWANASATQQQELDKRERALAEGNAAS